jgi:hypothetical protein
MALIEVLLADLIPLQERGKWFSIRAGTRALETVVGPHRWRICSVFGFMAVDLLDLPAFFSFLFGRRMISSCQTCASVLLF